MCDSVVIARPGEAVWLAKNSDREPSESQAIEHLPAASHAAGTRLRCTHVELDQVGHTHAITISRPTWMWGCEMGINEHGLALANEAVFTRLPIAELGLTSMDMQRLALERCRSADDAVELIIELLARVAQGGRMAHTGSMRYHGSFLIADPRGAWLLETAGQLWAALRVTGTRSISNALTIEDEFDRVHPEAYELARRRGWCRSSREFGFARCFGRPFFTIMGGARVRAARTGALVGHDRLDVGELAATLRDHGGAHPHAGLRMHMPCAHASWLPTRRAGQTTSSMIARLADGEGDGGGDGGARAWMTGTSSPCLSVFKPVPLQLGRGWAVAAPERADNESLWWRHERLHRLVLADWAARHGVAAAQRAELEARAFADGSVAELDELWQSHRDALPGWIEHARALGRAPMRGYWRRQSRRDRLHES